MACIPMALQPVCVCVCRDRRRQCAKIKQLPFDLCVCLFSHLYFSPPQQMNSETPQCPTGIVLQIFIFLSRWLIDKRKISEIVHSNMKHIEIWNQVKVSVFVLWMNKYACTRIIYGFFMGTTIKNSEQRTHTVRYSDCDNICSGGIYSLNARMKATKLFRTIFDISEK